MFVQHSRKSGSGADEGWSLHVFVRSHAIDEVCHVADWAEGLGVEDLIVLGLQVSRVGVASAREMVSSPWDALEKVVWSSDDFHALSVKLYRVVQCLRVSEVTLQA